MILRRLDIKNYRGFDEEGVSINFEAGINTIVGENHVGKSNILRALQVLSGIEGIVSPSDYHKNDDTRKIIISVSVELNNIEMQSFLKKLFPKLSAEKINEKINQIDHIFTITSDQPNGIYWGDFWIFNFIRLAEKKDEIEFSNKIPNRITEMIQENDYQNIEQTIKDYLQPQYGQNNKSAMLNMDASTDIKRQFKDKIRIFKEIRECTEGAMKDIWESFDGEYLPDILSKLKNGNREQRKKWRFIKEDFNKFFPNLSVDVIRPKEKEPAVIEIYDKNRDCDLKIPNVGSGIWEILIILTHIISFPTFIFGLDLPELHLHPHAQRLLRDLLQKKSEDSQFIVVSHSPIFIDSDEIEKIIVVRQIDGKTSVRTINENHLTPDFKQKIKRALTEDVKDLFFSKAVLIVEGLTEKGVFPIFSKSLSKSFDKYGITIIQSEGKFSETLLKILTQFDFPYLVVRDKDALMEISGSMKFDNNKIKTSSIFCDLENLINAEDFKLISNLESKIKRKTINDKEVFQYPNSSFEELRRIALNYNFYVLSSDFEEILGQDDNEKFFNEVKKIFGKNASKVICGRYVAEKILEHKKAIPTEIVEIINLVTSKV